MTRPHSHSNTAPKIGDHRGWAEHWGTEAVRCMIEPPVEGAPFFNNLNEWHAVRAARLAWRHACRITGYRYWDWRWRDEQERAHSTR